MRVVRCSCDRMVFGRDEGRKGFFTGGHSFGTTSYGAFLPLTVAVPSLVPRSGVQSDWHSLPPYRSVLRVNSPRGTCARSPGVRAPVSGFRPSCPSSS